MLRGKKILLGITGGIAAYKCASLVRLLVRDGAEVKVLMTSAAQDFVTAKTLSVLSRNEVVSDFFDNNANWQNHVKLAEWADLMLIAPLTANTLAKMANGICDNLLLATYFSAKSKTIVAPAMDLDMYRHPTVKRNLQTIGSFGNLIIPAEKGELASGLQGEGRMAEPENILVFLREHFGAELPLKGKRAIVNAGPTYEAIDPVRFIGNRSSGKMGIALAQALYEQGASVRLVLGPVSARTDDLPFEVVSVETGAQMYEETIRGFDNADIVICSAAVADYRPEKPSRSKIKKQQERISLDLVKTVDILSELGRKKTRQCLVGFALETDDLVAYAKDKLIRKNLDMIVANPANEPGVGIGSDQNRVTLIDRHNKTTKFELQSKQDAARNIVAAVIAYLTEHT